MATKQEWIVITKQEWIATQRIRRIAVEIEDYGYHTPDKDPSGSYDFNKVAVICYKIAHGLDRVRCGTAEKCSAVSCVHYQPHELSHLCESRCALGGGKCLP